MSETTASTFEQITDATFKERVIDRSHAIPVLVDFSADWCGPCRQIAKVLPDVARLLEGRLVIVQMDVDKNPRRCRTMASVPVLKIYRDGRVVSTRVGGQSRGELERWALHALLRGDTIRQARQRRAARTTG